MPNPEDDRIANEAVSLWVHSGLECAIAVGWISLNGYVRLPEGHPDWQYTSAQLAALTTKQSLSEGPEIDPELAYLGGKLADAALEHPDYNIHYANIDVEVHGSLTYGPDEFGWIGFDTAHGQDYWELDEVLKVLKEDQRAEYEANWRYWETTTAPMRKVMPWTRSWTVTELIAETEHLADQLVAHVARRRSDERVHAAGDTPEDRDGGDGRMDEGRE